MKAEDLNVGDRVTVLSWKPREVWSSFSSGDSPAVQTIQDRSFMGTVLTIRAIDLPYIVVEWQDLPIIDSARSVIDTRQCELRRVSDEYVRALRRVGSK